jgi:hypothetical protein
MSNAMWDNKTEYDLAHQTPVIYLKNIYKAFKTGETVAWNPEDGVKELFMVIEGGVITQYAGKHKTIPTFVSNELCRKIPAILKQKSELMKSIEKHKKTRR